LDFLFSFFSSSIKDKKRRSFSLNSHPRRERRSVSVVPVSVVPAAVPTSMQRAQQNELEAITDMFNKCALPPRVARVAACRRRCLLRARTP